MIVMVEFPVMVVNFKTYQTAIGENAVKLARICEGVSKVGGVNIMIAVQAIDIYRVSQEVSIPVLAQHIDPIGYGKYTGSVLPEGVKEAGAMGTLLNHSEKPLGMDTLKDSIRRAREIGLVSIVCASDDKIAGKVAEMKPDIISIEPPELVGTGIAVSEVKPGIVTKSLENVKKVNDIPVLCGAGIRKAQDIKKSLELGAKGILIASGVTKAEDPEKYLTELVKGFEK